MSEDMSPYCSAHDEWLIMKLCMYVGYHDTNNVSNFSGDPVTQLIFLNILLYYLRCFTDMALHSRDTVTVSAAVAFYFMLAIRYNTIKWPYQPKHSPSLVKLEHYRITIQ